MRTRLAFDDLLVPAFLVATAVSLFRAPDLPHVTMNLGSTSISVTIADLALALLGLAAVVRLVVRRSLPRRTWLLLGVATVLSVLMLISAAGNGSTAFIATGKLILLGALALAAALVLDRVERLWLLIGVLTVMNVAADVWGLKDFVHDPGSRQASFVGEHDLAALSTMTLTVWLAGLYVGPPHRHRRLAAAAAVAGIVGMLLGAALASLLGLYLAVAALALVAVRRGEFKPRALLISILIAGAITGGVLNDRSRNLGFLSALFGKKHENGTSAGAPGPWSQRLIFAYIGGRVFLAHPVFGTGWYPELPPKEWARYLPDAQRHFSDQPAHFFPPANGNFIPQQTYDQVLYELGIVGALIFLVLLVVMARDALRSAREWPRGSPDPQMAYVPTMWAASLLGVLAGIALFGGTPVAALYWLTLGVVAALAAAGGRRPEQADLH
jgi:O-Antigen ligase